MNRDALRRRFARTDAVGRLFAWTLALCFLAGPIGLSFLIAPEQLESGAVMLSPPCSFKAALGVECPTCGLTRGFAAISRGRLADSLSYNRATPLVYSAFWIGAGLILLAVSRAARDLRRAQEAIDVDNLRANLRAGNAPDDT